MERFDQLIEKAVEWGASFAALIPANQIVLDPRVKLKCRVPLCPQYNRNRMCPPNVMPFAEFQEVLSRYHQGLIVQKEGTAANEREADVWALALHELVHRLEAEAFRLGFSMAAGFIGGHCRLCEPCLGQSPEACPHPYKARPSLEGMGIDVGATLKNLGRPLVFGTGKVTWTGLILLE